MRMTLTNRNSGLQAKELTVCSQLKTSLHSRILSRNDLIEVVQPKVPFSSFITVLLIFSQSLSSIRRWMSA